MAETNYQAKSVSEESSSTSTPITSGQPTSRGSKHGQRPHQKVKFSNLSEEEQDILHESADGGIPEIRLSETHDVADHSLAPSSWAGITDAAAAQAQDRASRLHSKLSDFKSRHPQPSTGPISQSLTPQDYASPESSPPTKPIREWPGKLEDIALMPLDKDKRSYMVQVDTTDDDDSDAEKTKVLQHDSENIQEARTLLRTMTGRHTGSWQYQQRSGSDTPAVDKHLHDLDYIPAPKEYRPSPFTLATKLTAKLEALQRSGYTGPHHHDESGTPPSHKHSPKGFSSKSPSRNGSESHDHSTSSSGRITPSKRPKWYDRADSDLQSTGSLGALLAQSTVTSAATGAPAASNYVPRPADHRTKSSQSMIATAVDMIKHPTNYFHHKSHSSLMADEERVILDVAEIIACRKYLKKLARSLMAVGAPSHRLEEYMKTSARALNLDCDFLYSPGSMLVAINDRLTMSTEVTLVRESGGVDLGKFRDVFDVYKLVIHGKYTAEEGTSDLDMIMKKRGRHPLLLRIFAYGVAAISVGPFAFSARPIDFAPNFVLGATLGFLQLVVAPRSEQFSHVFEVLSAVLIAFASRGLGSIYYNDLPIFCFSAIAQSSIALILPGYMVLCAALELQSKSLVAGSVRMVYAIIYSLFLGFGILVGECASKLPVV